MRKFPSFLLAIGLGAVIASSIRRQNAERALLWMRERPGTALVTGASSGIGAAFARALAREGYDLILTARREDRLKALADEIQAQSLVRVEVLVADLDNPADLAVLEQRIRAKEQLDILVNNAGFGLGGPFEEIAGEASQRMVRVMAAVPMRFARAALPGMVARGRGGIINVSSMAGFFPAAGNSVYGSVKAQLTFFSQSLAAELDGTGVRVQALCPGFTYSEIHDPAKLPPAPRFMWMEAEQVVSESLEGLRTGRALVIPGRIYQLIWLLAGNALVRAMIPLARALWMPRLRSGSG